VKLPKVYNHIPADEMVHDGRIVKGLCGHDEHAIFINPDLSDQEKLITSVHELLHYILPEESEEWVEYNGVLIGKILWRLGYRSKSRPKKTRSPTTSTTIISSK
jgi:hypothetical protein